MWTLLSFTGWFYPAILKESIEKHGGAGPAMPGVKTRKQKQATRDAIEARTKLRRGASLARLQERLVNSGRGRLNAEQTAVLAEYESGALRMRANELTHASGNGRLKREDESFVDIGGSTGGLVRTVVDFWKPPDLDLDDFFGP